MIGKYAVQRLIPLCWRSSGHNRGEKCGPTLTFSLTFSNPAYKNLLTKIKCLLAGFSLVHFRHGKQTGIKSGLCFSI